MGYYKKLLIEMEERGNWPVGLEDKYVCASHFNDIYLQKKVRSDGVAGVCSYCGKKRQVANMQRLGEFIALKIHMSYNDVNDAGLFYADDFFEEDEDYGTVPGFKKFCNYVVPNDAECYDSTADLLSELGADVDNDELQKDIEDIFTTQEWVSRDLLVTEKREVRMNDLWMKFSDMVKSHRRFTFLAEPSFLEILTGPKDRYAGEDKNILTVLDDLIKQMELLTVLQPEDVMLYRSRKEDKIDVAYGFNDITSPPDKSAFNNRMSPAGISMFYASFDKNTAKGECVGEDTAGILVGTFRPKRQLRVIDLTAIPTKISFWMDYFQESIFLREFNKQVTKSIDPKEKSIEYIPTQVLIEYFRYMFKDSRKRPIDGVIYGSSKEAKNKNIVLFCDQKSSSEYVELSGPLELYTKKWVKTRDDKVV